MKYQNQNSNFSTLKAITGIIIMLMPLFVKSADIVEISPLTDRIILIHFSEGDMVYPNDLNVVRLNISNATNPTNYTITSTEDADFTTSINPAGIGRKSKGMEFVSNSGVPWGGDSFDPRSKPWVSEHWIYLQLDKPMKTGITYTIETGDIAGNGTSWDFIFDEKIHRSEAVHVNTLGYAPNAPKYGYVYQWMGDKGNLSLATYNGKKFWLYREGEDVPVFEGTLKSRSSATNPETGQPNDTPNHNFLGAEVYDCDFSAVSAEGTYTLVVEGIGSSFPFMIGPDAIWEAYYHGARSLYHQRSGIRLHPPFTEDGYIRPVTQNTRVTSDDGTDFAGQLLYCTLPWVEWDQGEGGGSSQPAIREASLGNNLDVAGWYHDAGDWDGYASHQRIPILLMLTYEAFPQRFMDGDLNIPESENGIPDIIDEASWLIKFNYRLRKELQAKGFSDGGVGGARVAPDFFTAVDGNAQSDKPSWQDYRRYVVTNADAYMTYKYAGQAAQFAYVLKSIGKDPENFPVEMLDHVDFDQMTYDDANWIEEAETAWAWATDPENQPSKHAHYSSQLWVYKMYAAASLYRLTGKEEYHLAAKEELEKVRNKTRLEEDERYGAYVYLLAKNVDVDNGLQSSLKDVAIGNANWRSMDAAKIRGLRWGGIYDMPMLIGQGTTPWMFETIFAYGITGDKNFADVVHTTVDYFLGTNPLHTTWMTGVGPRPARGGFHLDTRYLWDNNWMVYKGFVPYGPWSMAYGYTPFNWTIDGVQMQGGAGPWNKDWANFSMYPLMDQWPGHERYNNNIHAPLSTENTIHQQSVYLATTYGFVNNRNNTNSDAPVKVGTIDLDETEIIFNNPGEQAILKFTIDRNDAAFPAIVWTSSDPRIAHVDGYGRVTGITGGTATITISTLDGSVTATCDVICNWEDTAVNSISVTPENITLVEGQTAQLTVSFDPQDATNQFVNWSFSEEDIVKIDESNKVSALKAGTVTVTATSVKDEKTATVQIEVEERIDYIIADFDEVIPVTTSPQPDVAQLFTPEGTDNVEADNPLPGLANESEKVFQWGRPAGDWRLFGIVLATDHPQDLSRYSQLQFKYFGKEIRNFYIQLQTIEDTQIEINAQADGEDCWQLFAYDINSSLTLKQINVFVNPTGGSTEKTFYFDDFILSAESAVPFNQMQISHTSLELETGQIFNLSAFNQDNPFTWISSNPLIATVDQDGRVTAWDGGSALIKAVPLYGQAVECEVIVDGGDPGPIVESKMILDFEDYALDWNPYGSFAWGSDVNGITDNPSKTPHNNSDKVFSWQRDGTQQWAGFGIQFPMEQTADWDFFVFQVYSPDEELTRLRFVLSEGETEISAIDLQNLGIQPGVWATISFNIDQLVTSNTNFSRLLMQPFAETETETVFFMDNFRMEKMPYVAVEGIEIVTGSVFNLEVDETVQLQAVLTPENATNQTIIWSSNAPEVASVSDTGLVTGTGEGNATITATSEDNPEITATADFAVSFVSVEDLAKESLKIYPNPTSGTFRIESLQQIRKVEIYDYTGRIVMNTGGGNADTIGFDTDSWGKGLFLIKITTVSGEQKTGRLVVW